MPELSNPLPEMLIDTYRVVVSNQLSPLGQSPAPVFTPSGVEPGVLVGPIDTHVLAAFKSENVVCPLVFDRPGVSVLTKNPDLTPEFGVQIFFAYPAQIP